jgi:LCP family protein required for cell wall assembly
MQDPQGARPRARSPFTAAFLSLIFPGLGHLYAGATTRALGFAAPPILLLALLGGLVIRMDSKQLLGAFIQQLGPIFVFNLVALAYRLVAIIDAYRVTEFLNSHAASGDGRLGRARLPRNPLSLAGLAAVLLVMAGAHVVVARYDMLAQDARSCIFVTQASSDDCDTSASQSPGATDSGSIDEPTDQPTDTPTAEPSLIGTPVPSVDVPEWNGKDRLNILLIGADEQAGGHNTDTMITLSIDPVSKQVVMFSLPRDTQQVPVPPGPAQRVFGSTFGQKINSWFVNNRHRSDLWPGNDRTRGYNALKAIIGNLYGLDIKYFVEVNFDGFKKVIDEMGGVTINVQVPVVDDTFPGTTGRTQRLYIPSGIQHMNGDQALRYARSRHTSTDFDRGARQQRVLLSLREQADPQALIPRIPDLIAALKKAVRTDVPLDQIAPLLGLASEINTADIRTYVFSPPLYQQEVLSGYYTLPYVDRIRQAVKDAFTTDPRDEALRQSLAAEGGQVWVLNGTGDSGRATDLANYLEFHGLAASAPRGKPAGSVPAHTVVTVYNGAEDGLSATIAYLQQLFDVTVKTASDPTVAADVVVTIGRDTPNLQPPPQS